MPDWPHRHGGHLRTLKPRPIATLLVEDQPQLRKMAARLLRGYGYNVLEAGHPDEALRRCEASSDPIHLLLTDVIMPGMTGPELASRIKALRPSMEVVFMSGYSERAFTDPRILDSPDSYLAKPFSAEALAAKVRAVLGPTRLP